MNLVTDMQKQMKIEINGKKTQVQKDLTKLIVFKLFRYEPHTDAEPWLQYRFLDETDCGPMLLDNLFKLQHTSEYNNSLAFRRSCREGICGSCAMNINGTNDLACIHPMKKGNLILKRLMVVYPLPHMPVIKDLIVSFKHFYLQHKSIEPWIKTNYTKTDILTQTKAQRALLDGLYECILCACCSTSCPSYWWNSDSYLGPAILLQAFRWIQDSRDTERKNRLQQLNDAFKLYRCHTILNCTKTCPKHLNPAKAIYKIKKMILSLN